MARNTIAISIVGHAADALRAIRQTNASLKNLQSTTGVFGLVTKVAASRAALLSAGIAALIPVAFDLAHALSPLLGLLVALPGALVGGLSAFGAFKIATAGVADSIKSAFGGEDILGGGKAVVDAGKVASARASLLASQIALNKAQSSGKASAAQLALAQQRVAIANTNLQKALKGTPQALTAAQKAFRQLPPAAQTFVRSVVGLQPALRGLRASVSQAFFAPFAGQIKGLADRWIPLLNGGLTRIAGAMGRLASGSATVLRSPEVMRGVGQVMRAVSDAIDKARPGITALGKAILLMVGEAAPVIRQLGGYIGQLAGSFANWLDTNRKSGRMNLWLGNALKALRQIWHIGGNIVGVFKAIFKASGGSTLLAIIEHLTGKLSAFLNSTRGQNDLKKFFQGAQDAAQWLWGIVRQLLPLAQQVYAALKPVLPEIHNAVSAIVQTMIPALSAVAGWFKNHQTTLKLIVALVLGLKFVSWINNLLYISSILKGIYGLYKSIRTAQAATAASTAASGAATAGFAAGLRTALVTAVSGVGAAFASSPVLVSAAVAIAGALGFWVGKQIADNSWWRKHVGYYIGKFLVQDLPNNLFRTDDQVKQFGSGWSGWYRQFKSQSSDIGHWFGTTLPNHLFRDQQLVAEFGSGWTGWGNTFKHQSMDIVHWFSIDLPNALNLGVGKGGWSGLMKNLGHWFGHTLPDAINLGKGTGWSGLWNDFTGWWVSLWRSIVNWFKGLPSTLAAIGSNLITGFLNGIQTRWESAKAYIQNIPGSIENWFKQRLGIASPSRVMYGIGSNIVAGLTQGIAGSSGSLSRTMAGLNTTLSSSFTGGFGPGVKASANPLAVTIHMAPGTSTVELENQLVRILGNYQRRTGIQVGVAR